MGDVEIKKRDKGLYTRPGQQFEHRGRWSVPEPLGYRLEFVTGFDVGDDPGSYRTMIEIDSNPVAQTDLGARFTDGVVKRSVDGADLGDHANRAHGGHLQRQFSAQIV